MSAESAKFADALASVETLPVEDQAAFVEVVIWRSKDEVSSARGARRAPTFFPKLSEFAADQVNHEGPISSENI